MPILSKPPRDIHPAYKEAVVDSLLNGLSARLAGRGDFYKVIYGTKPSVALMSEFIVPMPADERSGDEEADPIRISAHGTDFQIRSTATGTTLGVSLTGAVYVRILPTEDEVKPGGRLEATFPLTREARAEIRGKVRDALAKLVAERPSGKAHPEWPEKSYEARKSVYESMGLPFNNRLDRAPAEEEAEGIEDENDEGDEEGEARPLQEVAVGVATPDGLAEDIPPPPKWLRLELTLPSFEFTPATAEADAKRATAALNEVIAKQLADWAASSDPETGGKLWGYKRTRVRPSDVRDWKHYLERVRASNLAVVLPQIELRWVIQAMPDPVDATRMTVHVALENWTAPLTKANFKELESSLFQVSITVAVPAADHQFLRLDRVKPSYRYNQYLRYPALGFNGGVTLTVDGALHRLTTTWTPRYVLPRMIPTDGAVERNIEKLSQPDCLTGLAPLIAAYEAWLTKVEKHPVDQGVDGPEAAEQLEAEKEKLRLDLTAWHRELGAIRCGLDILEKSRANWSGPGVQKSPLGIPFEAWVSMNTAMAKVAKSKGYDEWRLFQLAFILASIPAFATRIPEFHSFYTPDVAKHANAVTLLYFSTGGGKSEAFLGLLAFVLFLDRLRGKHRGVSALMRYPLRLLTLQQARRTFATMGAAEEVRHAREHPGEPFSLGFWVGGSNTPNWHSEDGYTEVPGDNEVPLSAESKHKDVQPYKSARERWLKLSSCPFCGNKDGSLLALRRYSGIGTNAMGHYCSAPKEKCSWNARFTKPTPLPFYIVDEDIYDLAPSVLLGTVDKLAAIGQSQGTIRKFFGMFGFAPLVETGSERLYVPMKPKDWDGHPGASTRALFPSFASGEKRFFDPFPALLIQDEAHLLDESLGTFSGLFESALEAAFDQLSPLLKGHLSYEPKSTVRRKIKIIAASATVSEPERQMHNLYQRGNTVQFPYPGPTIYDSFYATPLQPDASPNDTERTAISIGDVELRSHWARVYASVLTNGHRHTVAMASVLGHYHLMLTGLYERLRSEDPTKEEAARSELIRWVSPGPLQAQFVRFLAEAGAATLLTLVDLHRIALTYVTNKKGGDQVIDTEKIQFEKLHEAEGYTDQFLNSELISGAVSAADIQDIVRRAETRVGINKPFPELNETLRSIIATSAISHGVDVEEFNAMFFAGIPSDIAEYIQASSRVGRTHVGFSLLVPVPQRHRDRFVLEIHDIFHRFLERMILPAAVDRWAEKALVRVMPSFFQEYVCGMNAIERLCASDDDKKRNSPTFAMAPDVRDFLADPANVKTTEAFMEKALGLSFSPSPEGKNYYRSLLKGQLTHYHRDLCVDRLVNGTRLVQFFATRNSLLRPMTSLRDVDQPGLIYESRTDASYKRAAEGMTARAMDFIRRGPGADIDSTDNDTEARS
ncbi:helicase-like protein [Burkholderia pseudomallei]|uniref:DEAD/DEAH box helicase n=2 Tax=Burkholderia pseudomallei TaxID=28450 RepID=UPI0006AD76B4|nr:DEAD/DEAH box helicase [Burkholderia pseudomallei]ALB95271.1 helicase [Burkholderia pseudomallei]ALC01343.1 helicase [Burkholderia pseudomallei]MBF3420093.1 DEAD/DEAH box helicase [Burkholderia pseudomallei]MBO7758201.1 DEAD/DEAH box helicase [Burkholderia pseudomallei]MBO7819719.1 DEAD/DEAH box helicase [Burkholderia pseudomallei]